MIDDRFFFIADGRCGFRFVNRGVSGFLIDDFNRFTGLSDNRCATVAAVGADNDGSRDGRGSRGLNVNGGYGNRSGSRHRRRTRGNIGRTLGYQRNASRLGSCFPVDVYFFGRFGLFFFGRAVFAGIEVVVAVLIVLFVDGSFGAGAKQEKEGEYK